MQYIDAFCRGLYKGFLNFVEVMTRPSSMGVLLAFAVWFGFIILAPTALIDTVALCLAGWFVGGKIGELHTWLKGRYD